MFDVLLDWRGRYDASRTAGVTGCPDGDAA